MVKDVCAQRCRQSVMEMIADWRVGLPPNLFLSSTLQGRFHDAGTVDAREEGGVRSHCPRSCCLEAPPISCCSPQPWQPCPRQTWQQRDIASALLPLPTQLASVDHGGAGSGRAGRSQGLNRLKSRNLDQAHGYRARGAARVSSANSSSVGLPGTVGMPARTAFGSSRAAVE